LQERDRLRYALVGDAMALSIIVTRDFMTQRASDGWIELEITFQRVTHFPYISFH
jgi:hypothetical protein